jgi:hypothetical protein
VPIETEKIVNVHTTDTIKQTDTVQTETNTIIRESRPEDSLMLAQLGIKLKENERLLILMQKELTDSKHEKEEYHHGDSVRVEIKEVPVPVEKPLSRWQRFTLEYGAIAIGITLVGVILLIIELVRWIRRKDK